MNPTTVKPGVKTTEFWIAVVAQLIPLLVMFGVVTADQGSTLNNAIAQAVAAVVALVAAVMPIVEYIKSRTAVKTALAVPPAVELTAEVEGVDVAERMIELMEKRGFNFIQ